MTRRTLAAVFLVCFAGGAVAAEPPMDTSFLKLYAETRGFMLGRPTKPKITPDGKAVLFLRSEAKSPKNKLFEFDVATGKTRELLSPESLIKGADENLTPEEKARRERQRVSTGGFADFHLDPDGKRVLVKLANTLFVLDRATGKTTELKTGKDGAIVDPKWSPDGKLIGYVRGFDVYAYDLAAEKESAVTTGGTQVKTHGLAEFVAQEEMGRHSGFWWSPDSKSIAYEEADHTGVEQWFVADPLKPDSPPTPQYYPRPGKKNVSVRLGVKKLSGGDTVWMSWNERPWEYLAKVEWGKHGPLTAIVQARDQKELCVLQVDPNTSEAKKSLRLQVIEDDWINLHETEVRWVSDDQFVLLRNKFVTSFKERGDDRSRMVDLRAAFVDIEKLVYFNPDTRGGLFEGTWHPSRMHAFSLRAGNPGKLRLEHVVQLSHDNGIHSVAGTDTNPIVTSSTPRRMPLTRILDSDGKILGTLPHRAEDPPFHPRVMFLPNPPEPTLRNDGIGQSDPPGKNEFFSAIVKPQNFDSSKKYPVIVDVYGGPKHLHVVQAMRNWLVPQWLADQGFIVVAIDGRGTPGRGAEWEKAIYKKFGTVPIEDQVKGLDALCKQFPEMDRERVGIVGWSFGGYNAANGVLRRPDVFKAAVAGAPVTDWEDYDTHYTERYLGLLPESKAAYDEASLIPLAKNLKRPLLLVHGTADDNVYYRHTLKLSDALFRAGRDFETLALPGITHMYSADLVIMERLWAKTAGFFKKHLGEPK
jgi:dipeptidyl-peptidase-4